MRIAAVITAATTAILASASLATPAHALPMFARKYKMECSGCHDNLAFPRLNDVGYKFRRAGFRMPENIGKDELSDFAIEDYFSASAAADYEVSHDDDGTASGFALGEITLRPITGSFQKYFASQIELALSPEGVEVGNAFVRGVYGGEDRWISMRVGAMHPIEGYGAMDRPLGLSTPLFESRSPSSGQDTLTQVIGRDRLGADVGVQWGDESLSVEVLNRIAPMVADGEIGAEGVVPSSENGKDLLVVGNHIFDGHSGIGFYWDHGRAPLPLDPAAFAAGTGTGTWSSAFDRAALFASYGRSHFTVLAGGELAYDEALDAATGARQRFAAGGGYVEGDIATGQYGAAYLRLDYFDPSADVGKNEVLAATAGARIFQNWISVVPELQILRTADGDASSTRESFVVECQAIY